MKDLLTNDGMINIMTFYKVNYFYLMLSQFLVLPFEVHEKQVARRRQRVISQLMAEFNPQTLVH